MTCTKPLTKLSNKDVATAGGKGASLGELMQTGIQVPNGFVILTDAFNRFLDNTDLRQEVQAQLNKADQDKMHTIEHASERIQSMILRAEMPKKIAETITKDFSAFGAKYVAVRSSATAEDSDSAAWAGQLDTYLNITEETLLENVKKCWASLFTPRAIFYRFEKGLKESNVSVAVVVQEMIESEKSGIAFSVHPVTQDKNQMIIEAGFGLGEAVVSGTITPDAYVVSKKYNKIIDTNVHKQTKALYRKEGGGNKWIELNNKGVKQVLNEKDILKLAEIIKKIENHYKIPQDIEWAFVKGEFYITQSRPITTLNNKTEQIDKKNLVNIFSREKNLSYFNMWDDSDRKGMNIIGEKIKYNLFIVPPIGQKGSVWYEKKELNFLKYKLINKLKDNNNDSWKLIKKLAEKSWKFIEPYVQSKKEINNTKEFENYYKNLVDFWVCLNSILYEVLDSPKIDRKIIKYLKNFRYKTEKHTEKMSSILSNYLDNHYRLKDISRFVTIKEAIGILNNKIKDKNLEGIKKRATGCFMLNGVVYPYADIQQILKDNTLDFEKFKTNVDKINGDIAFGGLVKGNVKIIDGFQDLKKIQNRDILVTQMTNPKYLPAIKKVLAIVTDQGGTLCHAAIIARELKKPCIIGTKIATQVLKNGDLVEVDADNGVVRILKSKELNKKFDPKNFIDLDKWQYEFQQRNDNPVIMSDTWTRAVYVEMEKELKLSIGKLDYLLVASAKGYVKKKQKEKIIKQLQKSTAKDEYLQYIYDTTKKRMFGLRRMSNRLLKHVDDKSLNKNKLAIIWNNFDKLLIKVVPWFFIPWYVTEENILSNRVKQGLEKHKDKIEKITDINNALALLMFPIKKTLFQKEHKSLFRLVKIAQEKKSFEKDKLYLEKAKKYLDEFEWMTTYLFVPLEKMTLSDLNKKVHQSIKDGFVEQYTLQEKAKRKNKKNTQQILKEIGRDKKLLNDVAWARDYAWLLTYSVEHAFISFANLIPFCKFLANNLGATYKEWSLFTTEEIIKSLKGEIKLTKTEIQKRKMGHVMLIKNGKQTLLVGKQAVDTSNWIDKNVGKIKERVDTISGQPAYPGKIKGVSYIAKNAKNASSMPKGRVLVCAMTTPDYVPSMRNAVAIITDEGGLLSHAAIISRELGVPCIVGTKIATRVLKNGDLVEVNADEGFVHIIEKSKK